MPEIYARPRTIEEAVSLLVGSEWTPVAGGTDYYPALKDRPVTTHILDLSRIAGLDTIERRGPNWRIGARVTWSDVVRTDLPPAFDALKLAAREIGSVQIQNRATLVGNLCNASPAADGVPPLLILNASVELTSARGQRLIALAEFIKGNRSTARRIDELVTAIVIPIDAATGSSCFLKLGSRKYLVISIAMVAARLDIDQAGLISDAAVSVGACSETAQRLPLLEQKLIGHKADAGLRARVTADCLAELRPIDDIRAAAAYRLQAAQELIGRALLRCRQPSPMAA